MKIRILSVFFILFASSNLFARDILVEFKPSYFIPQDSTMRDIYSHGFAYSLEGSVQAKNNIYGWTSVSYFEKSGKSQGGNDSTKVTIVPIALGIKYIYTIPNPGNIHVYLGGGVTASYFHVENDYPSIIEKHSSWGGGLILKSGLLVDLTKFLFFDLFVDYSYAYLTFRQCMTNDIRRHNVNIGGVSLGLGLGLRF